MDINCSSVDWPGNTLYQIGPGSKPRACLTDLEESAVGGSINLFGSSVGGVPGFLSFIKIIRKILP